MKICIFSRSAYPLFNPACKATFGGAEVDMYLLAVELAKDARYDVTCVVGDFGQPPIENISGVTIVRAYAHSQAKIVQMAILVRVLKNLSADWYVQESASGGTGIIAALSKILGKKFMYRTASDIDADGTFANTNAIEGVFFKFGLRNATRVIAQNATHESNLMKNYGLKSTVIRNAIAVPPREHVKTEHVLWVGRSETLKQPYLFLDIAKQIPNEKFVMICPPANASSVDVALLAKTAKAVPNVLFIPGVPYEEIDIYFKKAKLLINTSRYEGFPNTFVQALKYGAPVFSLNVDPDGFISRHGCGHHAHGDMDVLTLSLKKALGNTELLSQMSSRAYQYVTNHHELSQIANAYKREFARL